VVRPLKRVARTESRHSSIMVLRVSRKDVIGVRFSAVARYEGRATPIKRGGNLDGVDLSAGSNPVTFTGADEYSRARGPRYGIHHRGSDIKALCNVANVVMRVRFPSTALWR
jgi:hypothetical protein